MAAWAISLVLPAADRDYVFHEIQSRTIDVIAIIYFCCWVFGGGDGEGGE